MRRIPPLPLTVLFASVLSFLSCSTAPAADSAATPHLASPPTSPPTSPAAAPSASSAASSASPVLPDEKGEFVLAVGGRAEVKPGVLVLLDRIVSDSRCPVDVNCIWAGEIRVALVAESTAGKKEMELWDRAPDAIVEGVNVKLIGASPAPNSKVHLLPSDYRIQFRATSASGTTAPATSRE